MTSHATYRWLRLAYEYDDRLPGVERNFESDLVRLPKRYNADPEEIRTIRTSASQPLVTNEGERE